MSRSGASSITLEQLIALTEEMAALARAGVPLDHGLTNFGQEMGGRLGRAAEKMGGRLEAGEDLAQILQSSGDGFPPAYRAALEAGLRSGRLAAALEGVAAAARRSSELRRSVVLALFYPIAVLLVGLVVFVFIATRFTPIMLGAFASFRMEGGDWLAFTAALGEQAWWWAPLAILVFAGLVLWGWFRSRRPAPYRWNDRLRLWPSVGQMLHASRVAAMADLLTLLVENETPLPQAVRLAGEASGNRRLARSAQRFADAIERGERPPVDGDFPPLLHWTLATTDSSSHLAASLGRLAAGYHEQAQRAVDQVAFLLPGLLTVLLGATVVLAVGAAVLGPYFQLLFKLGGQDA